MIMKENKMNYTLLKTNEKFPFKLSSEGVVFEYTISGPILILSFTHPLKEEIEGVKIGKCEMGLYEKEPCIFISVKIQGCGGWMEAPFSIRKYDNQGIKFDWSEDIEEGKGLSLQVILVDTNTNIIKSQRLIGTSKKFARRLREMILKQLEKPFSNVEYNKAIDDVYKNLSSADIARRAECVFKIK